MKISGIRWSAAVAGALIAEVAMIAAAFAWVAIYSYLLHPGESPAFYQRYAELASPWVALLAGVPIFYLVCRRTGGLATALAIFAIYFCFDAPIVIFASHPPLPAWFVAVNYVCKFGACYLAGNRAARPPRLP